LDEIAGQPEAAGRRRDREVHRRLDLDVAPGRLGVDLTALRSPVPLLEHLSIPALVRALVRVQILAGDLDEEAAGILEERRSPDVEALPLGQHDLGFIAG